MSEDADYPPFDLLGDPVDPNHGGKGRRTHKPSDEKRRLVVALCAFGYSIEQIAAGLAVTPPTLRKYYKKQLIEKEAARMRAEGKVVNALLKRIEDGSVAAMRTFIEKLEKHDLRETALRAAARPAAAPKLGKKESLLEAATKVGGIYATPAPPGERVN